MSLENQFSKSNFLEGHTRRNGEKSANSSTIKNQLKQREINKNEKHSKANKKLFLTYIKETPPQKKTTTSYIVLRVLDDDQKINMISVNVYVRVCVCMCKRAVTFKIFLSASFCFGFYFYYYYYFSSWRIFIQKIAKKPHRCGRRLEYNRNQKNRILCQSVVVLKLSLCGAHCLYSMQMRMYKGFTSLQNMYIHTCAVNENVL